MGRELAGEVEPKVLRADAARNRLRILEAAEEVFARDGIAVPVDVVAERAGVGVGTLYRHFPTKEALFQAIVESRLTYLVGETRVDPDGEPGEEFFGFLARMGDQVSLKHDLFDAIAAAGVDVKSGCADLMEELESGIDHLRRRAVEAGAVRDDVSTPEVIGLVVGTCMASDHSGLDQLSSRQMRRVVCDGLRADRNDAPTP